MSSGFLAWSSEINGLSSDLLAGTSIKFRSQP